MLPDHAPTISPQAHELIELVKDRLRFTTKKTMSVCINEESWFYGHSDKYATSFRCSILIDSKCYVGQRSTAREATMAAIQKALEEC